jgi:hypothetical protein
MKQEATSKQKTVGRKLAEMAGNQQIQYTPTGQVEKSGNVVWHEMYAQDGAHRYMYWLRRDWGSYAGGF